MADLTPGWSSGGETTITEVLARAVAAHAQRIFLDVEGRTWTYGEVDERATRLAHGLAALGVGRGHTVASILDNTADAVFLWLAVNKLGAVSVPVNTAYKGEFLRHQLGDSGARVIVAEAEYALRVAEIADGLPEAAVLLQRGGDPVATDLLAVSPLEEAFASQTAAIPDENRPGDLALLIYTGGTTGPSKGCMISHNYACMNSRQILRREGRTAETINWTPLPLFHLNAICASLLSSMMVGARVSIARRFSVSGFWPEVERSGATVVNLMGSMIVFIANAPDSPEAQRCYGQLHAVRASPFTPEMQARWRERFGVTHAGSNSYGLTEAARVTMLADGEDAPPGSSGLVAEEFEVRIVDDDDNEVPVGTAGEVVIRPKRPHSMFEGYWRRPQETLQVMRNMWLHSGDMGRFDEAGFFYFVDRKKDYLRRRGENISSYEVETGLRAHPAIADVAVHAVFAKDAEDDVKATAVLKPGAVLTEEAFCRWSIDRLPYFAVPRYFEFRDDLPRSHLGRVLKYQLRDEGCTATTWDREAAGLKVSPG